MSKLKNVQDNQKEMKEIKINFQQSSIFDPAFATTNYQSNSNKSSLPQIKNLITQKFDHSQRSTQVTNSSIRFKSSHRSPTDIAFNIQENCSQVSFDNISHNRSILPEKRQELRDQSTISVLEQLRERNCKDNIKRYKSELQKIKYHSNPFGTNISTANIEKQVKELGEQAHSIDETYTQYQQLKEYLRLYKQKLNLVPKHQIMDDDKDQRGLDYYSYKDMKSRNLEFLDVVKEHQYESDTLLSKMGLLNQIKRGKTGFFRKKRPIMDQQLVSITSKSIITEKKLEKAMEQQSQSLVEGGQVTHKIENFFTISKDNFDSLKAIDDEELEINLEVQNIESKLEKIKQAKLQKAKLQNSQLLSQCTGHHKESSSTIRLTQCDSQNLIKSNLTRKSRQDNTLRILNTKEQLYTSVDYAAKEPSEMHLKNMSSLSNIYKSCRKISYDKKKLKKRYQDCSKDLQKELLSCKNLLDATMKQNLKPPRVVRKDQSQDREELNIE